MVVRVFSKLGYVVLLFASLTIPLASALAQSTAVTWQMRVCADRDNLPYSNEQQQGFENHIATLLAQDLHAELVYVWLPKIRILSQDLQLLNEGKCDLFLDAGSAPDPYLPTLDYYQSSYVFVYRADASFELTSLDDAFLKELRIGVVAASSPDLALGVRGLQDNLHHYYPNPGSPVESMIADVVNHNLDVGIMWGPITAFYAAKQGVMIDLVPVIPLVDASGIPMTYATAMGVRAGDTDLRDLLNLALAHKWTEIQQVLRDYNVPLQPLPRPLSSIGG